MRRAKSTISAQIAELRTCRELRNRRDIARYLKVMERLRNGQSRSRLQFMLRSLRDTEAGEVQYELIEACEAHPEEMYLEELANAAPTLVAKAPFWSGMLFQSVLNAAKSRRRFLEHALRTGPRRKKAVQTALQQIVRENPAVKRYREALKVMTNDA